MQATIQLEDSTARLLGVDSSEDLPASALRAMVAEAFRCERISHHQAGQILGLDRFATDAFLKAAAAFPPSDAHEFDGDLTVLRAAAKPAPGR